MMRLSQKSAETKRIGHIDALAKKYTGQDRYGNRKTGEVRVTYKIMPGRLQTMG